LLGSEFACNDLVMTPYAGQTAAIVANMAHMSSSVRAGIAQSVERLATGWPARCQFESELGANIFTSPRRPDRIWGPSSLLSKGYRRIFPRR
jgi:hypothetical protein